MKPFYWFLIVITVFWWGMYTQLRDVEQQAWLPVTVTQGVSR